MLQTQNNPPDTSFQAYVINLKHATERWELVKANLEARKIPYTRIEGVYGDQLPDNVEGYHRRRYNITHGKTTNKREIGCYFSHIKALREFLASGNPYGLILEDDIALPANITELLHATLPYAKHWDMIRLTAFTKGKHLIFADLPDGHGLSYNLKVLKNTGAYFLNRHAAECIIEKMLPMHLPYDVALDREWHYGFKTACITPLPIRLNMDLPGQIPPARKIRLFRATTFKYFHAIRHVERHIYRKKYFEQSQ